MNIILILGLSFLLFAGALQAKENSQQVFSVDGTTFALMKALQNQDFFKKHESRTRLLGLVRFCERTDVLDKMEAQNITTSEVVKYFNDRTQSNEEKEYLISFTLSFIAGYSQGTFIVNKEFASNASQEHIAEVCNEVDQAAKIELERPNGTEEKPVTPYLQSVQPVLENIWLQGMRHTQKVALLSLAGEHQLSEDYIKAVRFEDVIRQEIRSLYPDLNDENLKKYEMVSVAYLTGAASGKVRHLMDNISSEEERERIFNMVVEDTKKKIESIR